MKRSRALRRRVLLAAPAAVLAALVVLAAVVAAMMVASAAAGLAAPGPVPPAPVRWVTDSAGYLSAAARGDLDGRLQRYQRQTGHQVLVWIARSTGGVPIQDFTVRAFHAWGIGNKGASDGLVIFLFTEDRKLRIEVGYGLEDRVPDAIASRIIREQITPRLAAGDHDGAVRAGVDAVLAAIGGGAPVAAVPAPRPVPSRGVLGCLPAVLMVAIFAVIVALARRARSRQPVGGRRAWGSSTGGGGATGSDFSSSGGGSNDSGSSSDSSSDSGGGDFSGGGGDSGGGGADGSW